CNFGPTKFGSRKRARIASMNSRQCLRQKCAQLTQYLMLLRSAQVIIPGEVARAFRSNSLSPELVRPLSPSMDALRSACAYARSRAESSPGDGALHPRRWTGRESNPEARD